MARGWPCSGTLVCWQRWRCLGCERVAGEALCPPGSPASRWGLPHGKASLPSLLPVAAPLHHLRNQPPPARRPCWPTPPRHLPTAVLLSWPQAASPAPLQLVLPAARGHAHCDGLSISHLPKGPRGSPTEGVLRGSRCPVRQPAGAEEFHPALGLATPGFAASRVPWWERASSLASGHLRPPGVFSLQLGAVEHQN